MARLKIAIQAFLGSTQCIADSDRYIQKAFLCFYWKNGYAHAPQCYVLHTLPSTW